MLVEPGLGSDACVQTSRPPNVVEVKPPNPRLPLKSKQDGRAGTWWSAGPRAQASSFYIPHKIMNENLDTKVSIYLERGKKWQQVSPSQDLGGPERHPLGRAWLQSISWEAL